MLMEVGGEGRNGLVKGEESLIVEGPYIFSNDSFKFVGCSCGGCLKPILPPANGSGYGNEHSSSDYDTVVVDFNWSGLGVDLWLYHHLENPNSFDS